MLTEETQGQGEPQKVMRCTPSGLADPATNLDKPKGSMYPLNYYMSQATNYYISTKRCSFSKGSLSHQASVHQAVGSSAHFAPISKGFPLLPRFGVCRQSFEVETDAPGFGHIIQLEASGFSKQFGSKRAGGVVPPLEFAVLLIHSQTYE